MQQPSTVVSAFRAFAPIAPKLAAAVALTAIDGGYRSAATASFSATLPRLATGGVRIEVPTKSFSLAIDEQDLSATVGVVGDGAVVYPDVRPDTDVMWLGAPGRLEEWRILRTSRAPRGAQYRLHTDDAAVVIQEHEGRLRVLDRDGRVALQTEPAYAVDALGVQRALAVTLTRERAGEWTMTTALDDQGLRYPIAVDPAWTTGPGMSDQRENFTAVPLADGRVLLNGGDINSFTFPSLTEVYDPVSGSIASGNPEQAGQDDIRLRLPSGNVFRAGGRLKLGGNSSASIWSPIPLPLGTWTAVTPMTRVRSGAAAVFLSATEVLVIGAGKGDHAACEYYNASTTTGSWVAIASMTASRDYHTATVLSDGTVLVTGGYDTSFADTATSERYNRTTNAWTSAGGMGAARSHHTATLLPSGKVLVVGGATKVVDIYDRLTGWSLATPIGTARLQHTATLLKNGKVLVAGGGTPAAEIYDPATNAWISGGSMSSDRVGAGAALLPDGRVLLAGGNSGSAVLSTTEIWGQLSGASCAIAGECVSGFCTDGVCCDVAACAGGLSCAVPGKKGTCSKALGVACSVGSECGSGFCADGVCCGDACSSQCGACNLAGSTGTCAPVSGPPVGGRAACGGAGGGTACGARCNGSAIAACVFPDTTASCGAPTCASGVETRVGTCSGAGVCNTTTKACGAFACGATACLTACAATVDCAGGYFCKGTTCVPIEGLGAACTSTAGCTAGTFCSDGVCCGAASCGVDGSCALPGKLGICSTKQGAACSSDAQCGTGFCVDSVCCESRCDGQCEACDVESKVGRCAPVSGPPHGSRDKCPADATNACAARVCDGISDTTKCVGYGHGSETSCGAAKCASTTFTAISSCDGAGSCLPPRSSSCVPYACTDAGCRKTCSKREDCAPGFSCKGDRCEAAGAECSEDRQSSIGLDGTPASCVPFLCTGGACATTCNTSDECASGYVCDDAHNCVSAAPPGTSGDSGGCALTAEATPSPGIGGRSLVLALLATLGALGRWRRRKAVTASGARGAR